VPANRMAYRRGQTEVCHPDGVDEEGYPIGDESSTTYVGAIESCEEFGRRLYPKPGTGLGASEEKSGVGDGAHWMWNQANLHFPEALQIVDLSHGREHLWDLAAKLLRQRFACPETLGLW
jgi:hypothetical protein